MSNNAPRRTFLQVCISAATVIGLNLERKRRLYFNSNIHRQSRQYSDAKWHYCQGWQGDSFNRNRPVHGEFWYSKKSRIKAFFK